MSKSVCKRLVIRDDRTSVTQRPEVLGRIKAETTGVTECSRGFVSKLRTMGLSAIFNDFQAMLLSKRANFVHPAGLAKEVRHANGTSGGRKRCTQERRIYVECVPDRLHQNGPMTSAYDCKYRRNVSIRRNQYFTLRRQIQSFYRENKRVKSVRHSDAIFCADVFCEFGLKQTNLVAEYIPAFANYARRSSLQLRHEFGV